MRNTIPLTFALLIMLPLFVSAQGFLHTNNKQIVDAHGENILLRGIGTGNWMIQEGYMMLTGSSAGTQHEYRQKLIEVIGTEKTDSFYNVWLDNHFTRIELDSMKAWGFNSVRPALHYLWFTPPIEEETNKGEITFIDKGFDMLDSLVHWCSENEMYLILDMHGAPGGQGKNASISDYDPSKPSLWESDLNKQKLIALWRKIAERYADEPWIGGYDLINETNWDFENSGNENGCNCSYNVPLKDLFEDLIQAIREVDTNHIIYLEGNCWANNYNGLKSFANFDDNIVYSFHKYWNYNDQQSIEWIVHLRDSLNVPIWMGEGGENSNTWFTNAVHLLETNNIGWSWWPVKKTRVNNPFQVQINDGYLKFIDYLDGELQRFPEEEATKALFTWAEQHKAENCLIKYDVIDALIRQPHSTETKPFKKQSLENQIYATDYDLGRNGYAYFDTDTGNYRTSTGDNSAWNKGMMYRNDGVDIEKSRNNDTLGNGYNIYAIEKGEWLQYSVYNKQKGRYDLQLIIMPDSSSMEFIVEVNGSTEKSYKALPLENGWQTFQIMDIFLPQGQLSIRFKFLTDGGKFSSFTFGPAKKN